MAKTWARILDNQAVDVTTVHPYDCHHPNVAKEFVEVPNHVQARHIYDPNKGKWSPPAEPEPPPPPKPEFQTTVQRIDFWLSFTRDERMAMRASDDPIVVDFLEVIGDPISHLINLKHPNLISVFDHMVELKILTRDRADFILQGIPA